MRIGDGRCETESTKNLRLKNSRRQSFFDFETQPTPYPTPRDLTEWNHGTESRSRQAINTRGLWVQLSPALADSFSNFEEIFSNLKWCTLSFPEQKKGEIKMMIESKQPSGSNGKLTSTGFRHVINSANLRRSSTTARRRLARSNSANVRRFTAKSCCTKFNWTFSPVWASPGLSGVSVGPQSPWAEVELP